MDYKIVEKDEFKVIGVSKKFKYDSAAKEVPLFWSEHISKGDNRDICGTYGINIDEKMSGDEFEYIIADDYSEDKAGKEGYVVNTIPKFTWAVFPCHGSTEVSMQKVCEKVFSEWLPNCKDYEIAAGYNIEVYSDPSEYEKGILDENYYSEIWIPVKKK